MKSSRIVGLILLFVLAFALCGCGKTKNYDISKTEATQYLWDNCVKEVVDGKITAYSLTKRGDNILYIECYLPADKTFEQVEPLLEKVKQNVLTECSDKVFEPHNTFLFNSYAVIYVEFINPRNSYPNDYMRVAGQLAIYTEYFPVSEIEKAVRCY